MFIADLFTFWIKALIRIVFVSAASLHCLVSLHFVRVQLFLGLCHRGLKKT